MRAIAVEKFGNDPKMMTLPTPEPGPGDVQVTMAPVSINPLDWIVADRAMAQTSVHRFPLASGFDGAATITTTGDGVRDFSVGDQDFCQFWADPAVTEPGLSTRSSLDEALSGRSRRFPLVFL